MYRKKTGLGDVLVAPYGRVKLKGNILLQVKLRLGSSISLLRKTKNCVMKMTNIMYGHIFIALALPERKTTCFNLTSLSLAYLGLQPVLLLSNSGAAVVATLLSEAAAEVLEPVLPITLVKQAPLFNLQYVEFCYQQCYSRYYIIISSSSSSDTGSAPVFLLPPV